MKEWCSSGLLPDALSYCDDEKGLKMYKRDIQKMLEEIHVSHASSAHVQFAEINPEQLLVSLNTDDLLAELSRFLAV